MTLRELLDAATEFAPGYSVTSDGRIFSTSSNWRGYGARELIQTPDADGYLCVRINENGKRKKVRVHRVVADAYLPTRPSDGHQLRHLDGDRENNRAENLAWGTAKENADDRERHGRTVRGERSRQSTLSWADVQHIRRIWRESGGRINQHRVAEAFGISQQHVSKIVRYRIRRNG